MTSYKVKVKNTEGEVVDLDLTADNRQAVIKQCKEEGLLILHMDDPEAELIVKTEEISDTEELSIPNKPADNSGSNAAGIFLMVVFICISGLILIASEGHVFRDFIYLFGLIGSLFYIFLIALSINVARSRGHAMSIFFLMSVFFTPVVSMLVATVVDPKDMG